MRTGLHPTHFGNSGSIPSQTSASRRSGRKHLDRITAPEEEVTDKEREEKIEALKEIKLTDTRNNLAFIHWVS